MPVVIKQKLKEYNSMFNNFNSNVYYKATESIKKNFFFLIKLILQLQQVLSKYRNTRLFDK